MAKNIVAAAAIATIDMVEVSPMIETKVEKGIVLPPSRNTELLIDVAANVDTEPKQQDESQMSTLKLNNNCDQEKASMEIK